MNGNGLVRTGFEDLDDDSSGEEPLPKSDPELAREAAEILSRQESWGRIVSEMIGLYRAFPKLTRKRIEARLEEVYERIREAGLALGISAVSMPKLDKC